MIPAWVCPSCAKQSSNRPARSRIDNVTKICDECGMRESLSDFDGVPLSFETWVFPPDAVWVHDYPGDGLCAYTGKYVQVVGFTRNCMVLARSLRGGSPRSVSMSNFGMLFRRLSLEEGRQQLNK